MKVPKKQNGGGVNRTGPVNPFVVNDLAAADSVFSVPEFQPKIKKGKVVPAFDVGTSVPEGVRAANKYLVPYIKKAQEVLNPAYQEYLKKNPDATSLPYDEAVKLYPDYDKVIEHINVYNKGRGLTSLAPREATTEFTNQATKIGQHGISYGPTTPWDATLVGLFDSYVNPSTGKVQTSAPTAKPIKKAHGGKVGDGVKGYLAGGDITDKTEIKDPNYRKYRSDVGAVVGDIGLSIADLALGSIAPDLIKSEDYMTRGGAKQGNETAHGVGQVAGGVATGVLGAINPAWGAAAGAVHGIGSALTTDDKAISQEQKDAENIGASLGMTAGSLAGSKISSSSGADASDTSKKGAGIMSAINTGANVVNAVKPVLNDLNAADQLSGQALADYNMATTGEQKAMIIKKYNDGEYALKKGGEISAKKAKEILHDGMVHGKKLTDKQRKFMGAMSNKKADGGEIKGKGGPKTDSIPAKLDDGGFVVPAENAKIAERFREKYLGGEKGKKAKLNSGDVPVKISDGEHYFDAEEAAILRAQGVDLDALAPNADKTDELKDGGGPNPKLKKMQEEIEKGQKELDEKRLKRTKKDVETLAAVSDKKSPAKTVAKGQTGAGIKKRLSYEPMETFETIKTTVKSPEVAESNIRPTTTDVSLTEKAPVTEQNKSNFDLATALSLGQAGLGIQQILAAGKRPEDAIDPDFAMAVARAKGDATTGLSDLERSMAEQQIERNRRSDVKNVLALSGGSAGTALGNIRASSINAADATNNLAAQSEALRMQKQQYADRLVGQKAEMSRRLFADKLNAFNEVQSAGAGLIGSGIQNLIGKSRYDKELAAQELANRTRQVDYTGIY